MKLLILCSLQILTNVKCTDKIKDKRDIKGGRHKVVNSNINNELLNLYLFGQGPKALDGPCFNPFLKCDSSYPP